MHRKTEPRPHARPRRRRHPVLALVLTAALAGIGCTGALQADDDPPPTTGPARALQAWPDDEPVEAAASPAHPDVAVEVAPLLREPDGTTTVPLQVTNEGSDPLSLRDVFGFDGLDDARIVDPASRVRHAPVASESGDCLCSSSAAPVPAGDTAEAYVTFAEVDPEVEAVRVALPQWRPVDDVAVRDVELGTAPRRTTTFEADPDHQVAVEGVWRTDEGLVVRVADRNEGGEALSPFDLVDLADLAVIEPGTFRRGQVRTADGSAVSDPDPDQEVAAGDSITRDVLVADPGGAPDAVVVRVPEARRTLPIAVQQGAVQTDLDPTGLDEPRTDTLEGATRAEAEDLVALGKPEEVDVDEEGPEVELPDPGPVLTSEAQPEWSIAGRAVVRIGEDRSVLHLDLTRAGGNSGWPETIGYDLEELALIDTAEHQRLGPLEGSDGTDGSDVSVAVPARSTRTVHVAFPALADTTSAITVDVPGFGTLVDVPVVDGPDAAGPDAPVLASMVDDRSGRRRVDVLALGTTADDEVVLRLRRVNVSAPDAYEPPGDGLCEASLSDPDSDRRFLPLSPCVTTDWSLALGTGESLVQEVRFPRLPGDVDAVALELEGWMASAPIPVSEEVAPWYLDLPRPADAPDGDTLAASVGVADDLQTEVRDGDEVDLNLDTDVLFAFGSAELTPEAVARLQGVGDRLAGEVSGTVDVVGHTDSVGDEAANQVLSEQRAQAVAVVLRPILGSAVALEVEGRGETEPVAANEVDGRDSPDGRSRNRRVTITYSG